MSTGKVVVGIAAGLAAGALLGVLFAPARGLVTRKRVAQRATNYADDMKEKFSEYVDTITDRFAHIKEDGLDWNDRGKDNANTSEA
jgi:gas vesicle protein